MISSKTVLRILGIGVGLLVLSVISGYIAMNLSMERDRIEVPVVVGLELKEAARQLRIVGLQPRMAGEDYHAAFPKGAVIRQSPSGGSRVRKNLEVRLTVSRGRDETLAPDLTGQPLSQAQRLLAEQGLVLGPTAKVHTSLPTGMVIAQNPPAGFPTRRGTAVSVLISLGEAERFYVMPNLVGQWEEEAIAILKEMGLEPRVTYQSFPAQARRVVLQEPSFGTRVKEKEEVALVVGQ
ncbi:MAG: PASTA domain-containing protein [candidate division NC10 bacterium]|nr:PASTA domain-containing protein [candidate division NC10 bacterium]